MKLTAIERFQVERYRRGKSIVPRFEKKVKEYLEWEKQQKEKDNKSR